MNTKWELATEMVPGQLGQDSPQEKITLRPGLLRDTVPISINFVSVLPVCAIVSFCNPPTKDNFMNPGNKTSYSIFLFQSQTASQCLLLGWRILGVTSVAPSAGCCYSLQDTSWPSQPPKYHYFKSYMTVRARRGL